MKTPIREIDFDVDIFHFFHLDRKVNFQNKRKKKIPLVCCESSKLPQLLHIDRITFTFQVTNPTSFLKLLDFLSQGLKAIAVQKISWFSPSIQ